MNHVPDVPATGPLSPHRLTGVRQPPMSSTRGREHVQPPVPGSRLTPVLVRPDADFGNPGNITLQSRRTVSSRNPYEFHKWLDGLR